MTNYIQTDLNWLVGAEIVRVKSGQIGLSLWLQLPEPILLDGKEVSVVNFEIWQDAEGNGAGYLALVGSEKEAA